VVFVLKFDVRMCCRLVGSTDVGLFICCASSSVLLLFISVSVLVSMVVDVVRCMWLGVIGLMSSRLFSSEGRVSMMSGMVMVSGIGVMVMVFLVVVLRVLVFLVFVMSRCVCTRFLCMISYYVWL